MACGVSPDPISDDLAPTEVSSSRASFEATAPLEAGASISAERPLTLVLTLGRRMPPGSQILVAFPTAVQEESDALWSVPTTEAGVAGSLLLGGGAADRTEVAEAGRVRGGAGRIVLRTKRAVEEGEQIRVGLTGQVPQIVPREPFRIWEVDGSSGAVAALRPENVERPPVVAAPAAIVRLSIRSDVAAGEPLRLHVAALDRFGNVATGYTGRVRFETALAGLPAEHVFSAEDAGVRVFDDVRAGAPGVLRVRASAEIAGAAREVASNPARVWAGAPRVVRFVGDTHVHSGSDVASTTVPGGDHRGHFVESSAAFGYLRDVAALDWAISTEHDTGMTAKTWLANQQRVDGFNVPGEFVTLLGYEWTPERRVGHHVVVFGGEASPKNPLVASDRPGPGGADAVAASAGDLVTNLRRRVASERRAMIIPHMMQPFPNRDPERAEASEPHETWDGPAGTRKGSYIFTDLRRVAEIYSHHNDDFTTGDFVQTTEGRGNAVDQPQLFELGVANPWSLQHAWATGHRVGVVAGSDNHLGTPGMDNFAETVTHHGGLTVVFAETLTREAVFDALYDRRCYATTGARILLDFTVAGEAMGSEMYRKSGQPVQIALSVDGTAPLEAVEVVKFADGDFKVLRSVALDGATLSAALSFADPLDQPTIYYLRVRQTDGEMAWSSPVWVDMNY